MSKPIHTCTCMYTYTYYDKMIKEYVIILLNSVIEMLLSSHLL